MYVCLFILAYHSPTGRDDWYLYQTRNSIFCINNCVVKTLRSRCLLMYWYFSWYLEKTRAQRCKWIWNGICKCPGLFELFLTNSTFIGHLHMSILIFSPTFNICWKLTIFFCRETFPYDNFNWFMHIKYPKWHPLCSHLNKSGREY